MNTKHEVFSSFAEHVLDLACVATPQGHFVWLSSGWTQTLGWSPEYLLDTPFIDFVHPDDVEATIRETVSLSQGAPTVRFTNRYMAADGGWRWLEWTSSPQNGVYYCVVRDMTFEREKALEDARRIRLLELSLEYARAGYWRLDLVHDVVEWSPEIYAIHGVDPASYTPTVEKGVEAFHPDDRAAVNAAIERAIEEHTPFSFELRLIRADGAIRTVLSSGRPELDEDGNVIALFGIFRDVSDDPGTLRREELEQFAYVASHDLREPARTISDFIDLIREDTTFEGEQEKYFRFVSDASKRMLSMVGGLLHFARAGQDMRLVPVPLAEVVAEVVADLDTAIREKGVAALEIDPLPVVLGAREPLRQVMQNLVANALKFGPDDGCRIAIRSTRRGHTHVIAVEDNGPGIEPKHAERIFAPFQRLDTSKPGTGMGLSIVQRIVRQCGGRVWVAPSRMGGAAFHVSLRSPGNARPQRG